MRPATDAPLCVFCRRQPVDPVQRPFCSERCKIQDLARWADGSYAIAGEKPIEANEHSKDKT